jgi:hypothetical protein
MVDASKPMGQGSSTPDLSESSRRRGWTSSPEEISAAGVLVNFDLTAGKSFVEDPEWILHSYRRAVIEVLRDADHLSGERC